MNFEEISNKMKKFSRDTVAEVQKLNEVRQLNSKVNDEKKRMSNLYTEMGKKLYDLYKESPLEGFEAEFGALDEMNNKIGLLQDQVRAVKGVVLCPSCNMEVSVEEKFCSNCGYKMPQVFTIEEDGEATVVLEADDVTESDAQETETDGADVQTEAQETDADVADVQIDAQETDDVGEEAQETDETGNVR